MKNFDNFINGSFVPSQREHRIVVRNPATGSEICTVPDSGEEDVNAAVVAAETAQRWWEKEPAANRAKLLRAIAAKVRENVEPIARVITEEQGKTLGLARVEVEFTADYLDYMAEWGRRIEGEILESDRKGVYLAGVIVAPGDPGLGLEADLLHVSVGDLLHLFIC